MGGWHSTLQSTAYCDNASSTSNTTIDKNMTGKDESILSLDAVPDDVISSSDEKGKVNYLDLPLPVKYEDMHKEAYAVLRPELFEGMRFEFTKSPNQKFRLTHSVYMGHVEVRGEQQLQQCIKVPVGTYEFTASVDDVRTGMMGRVSNDGRVIGIVRHEVNDYLNFFLQAHCATEKGHDYSQAMFDINWRGNDYQSQIKLGNNQFYGLTYMQSVSPSLSMGGEAFWIGNTRKSGIGLALRHVMLDPVDPAAASILSCQVASTGLIIANYVQRVSDKLSLATDFLYNWNTKEATATIGYDYNMRQCKIQGKLDSNGTIGAFLVERLNLGLNFILSAEIDYFKKDYKFGFGLTVGTSI